MKTKKGFSRILLGIYRISRIDVILRDFFIPLTVFGIIASGASFSWAMVMAIIANLFVLLYAFVINDCEDAEDDSQDPKKVNRNPISAGLISYEEGLWIARVTAIITFVLSFFISGVVGVIVVASALLVGHLYSAKIIRFKSLPIIDFISHAYCLAMVETLLLFTLPTAVITTNSWLILFGLGLFSAGGDLFNEYRDYQVDRDTNLKNTASLISKSATRILSILFYVFGVGLIAVGILDKLF